MRAELAGGGIVHVARHTYAPTQVEQCVAERRGCGGVEGAELPPRFPQPLAAAATTATTTATTAATAAAIAAAAAATAAAIAAAAAATVAAAIAAVLVVEQRGGGEA